MTTHPNFVWNDCMKIELSSVCEIALTDIDPEDRLTDFSLDGCPEKLMDSVKVIGIRHPVSVCASGEHYALVSGHKRFQAAPRSGLTHIPAFIIPEIDDASRLIVNLNENFGQRHYSDIEKGIILNKFKDAGIAESVIIDQHMPLLELERSKKLLADFFSVNKLGQGLQKLLHNAKIPLKTVRIFYHWDAQSLSLAEDLFRKLKPGANKWKELLELIDEVAHRDEVTPGHLLSNPTLQTILTESELAASQKYGKIHPHFYNLRYPVLSELKKQVARAQDEMALDDKTRFKFQESFESNELKLELKFHSEKELSNQVEKIFQALQTGAVEKLIRIFQNIG